MGWLGAEGELAAAMAVGYAAESPQARPRKKLEDAVVEQHGRYVVVCVSAGDAGPILSNYVQGR